MACVVRTAAYSAYELLPSQTTTSPARREVSGPAATTVPEASRPRMWGRAGGRRGRCGSSCVTFVRLGGGVLEMECGCGGSGERTCR